jgi:predicted RNA-binding protein associated with RNAse of E/G family
MRFLEIKHTLDGKRYEYPCTLLEKEEGRAILLYVLEKPGQVAGVHLPPGTVTIGYFWTDRPYNLYHWVHPDGTTIAYYFNLADHTAIGEDRLSWRDLAVDILLTPEGSVRVLDEGDLPSEIDPALREFIQEATSALLRDAPRLIQQLGEKSFSLLRKRNSPG